MNKVWLTGRLVRDPDVRYTQGGTAVGTYTMAVDRRTKETDFLPCKVFGKAAEFCEKYLKKGMKISVVGRVETSSYTNKDGNKVHKTEIIVDEQEFAESKTSAPAPAPVTGERRRQAEANMARREELREQELDGFLDIPDGLDENTPFE